MIKTVVDPKWLEDQIFSAASYHLTFKLLVVPARNLNTLLKRIGTLTTGAAEYGWVHTALQIGDKIIDWNASGLAVPRTLHADAYTALDIHAASTKREIRKTPDLISNVVKTIIYWNKHYSYSMMNRNCQHFVNEILLVNGIKLFWTEDIESYLHDIITDPNNAKPHISYQDPSTKKLIHRVFKDHDDLHTFIKELQDKDLEQYMNLTGLLKAFDRGFWFQSRCNYEKPCIFGKPTTVGYISVGDELEGDL